MKDSLRIERLEQRILILEKQIKEPQYPTFFEYSMFMLVGFIIIVILAIFMLKYLNRELIPE